jgi:hypothetical protein
VGGGTDEMIFMEFMEALGAIACFKYPNPYIPLHIKVESMVRETLLPSQEKCALKGLVSKKKK